MHLRQLIRKQRCLVPANGFFIQYGKQVYFICSTKVPVLTLGGLWHWQKTEDSIRIRFSILTVPPSSRLEKLTLRMPLIVSGGSQRRFLDIDKPLMDITRLFRYETRVELNGYPVNPGIFETDTLSKHSFKPIGQKLIPDQPFPEKEIKGNYYLYMQS